jgi:phosphatidylethanolamine-binding protein (PEBP) family uncharacterized protein
MQPGIRAAAAAAAMLASGLSANGASAMALSFSWTGVSACGSNPPAFELSDVPEGTARLAFRMVDLKVPSFPHGGGTVAYQGNGTIPAGSFSYKGPCPPSGQHTYRWTVQALDAGGKVLATATASRPFPPR